MMCNVVEAMLYQFVASPALIDRIVVKQYEDMMLKRIKESVSNREGDSKG